MNSCEDKQIDEVISYLQENNFDAEHAFNEPVYRKVICGFLYDFDDIPTIAGKTDSLRYILCRYRPTLSKEIIGYPKLNWEERKNQAAELIDQAAGLLDDPILGTDSLDLAKLLNLPDDHPSLINKHLCRPDISRAIQKRIKNRTDIEKLAELDILAIVIWHISLALQDTPTEKIIPLKARNLKQSKKGVPHIGQPHEREGYAPDDASKTKKSNRAVLIRRIDRELSEHTETKYSVIANLVNLAESMQEEAWRAAFKDTQELCTRQEVRSILTARQPSEIKTEAKKKELINKFLFKNKE